MNIAISTSDAARILGVAPATIVNWINQGKIKAGRTVGGHRRLTKKDVLDFARELDLPVASEFQPTMPKILIVDDDVSVLGYLADAIGENFPECEILTASDGFAAGQIVGASQPEVVLLDLRMPDMDGFKICRRIKAQKKTKNAIVVAMTAYPSADAERNILDCGAEVCLAKPIDLDVLKKSLETALYQRGFVAH